MLQIKTRVRRHRAGWARTLARTGLAIFAGSLLAIATSGVVTTTTGVGLALAAVGIIGWLVSMLVVATSLVYAAAGLFGSQRQLAASAEGLEIDGQRLPKTALESGVAVPGRNGWRVDLTLRDGDLLRIGVRDEDQAEALLSALELDVFHRSLVLRWSKLARKVGAAAVAALAAVPIGIGLTMLSEGTPDEGAFALLFFLLPILFFGAAAATVGRRELQVGADGVLSKSSFAQRLIRFADVARVSFDGHSLSFHRHDGEVVRLPLDARDEHLCAAAAQRAIEAHRRHAAGEIDAALAHALSRNDRDMATWKNHLETIFDHARYRRAAWGRDAALALVDDPSASAEARIGAAIALSRDPDGPSRTRIAAERTAAPKMRIALQDAIDGELEMQTLEAAVEEERSVAP